MNQKTKDRIAEIQSALQDILMEEEDKLSNMEDKFSETQKYQDMEEVKDKLDEAITLLEEVASS